MPQQSEDSASPLFARSRYRLRRGTRSGYQGATLLDFQLESLLAGTLVWSHTFTDPGQAEEFAVSVDADLDNLSDSEFRRKYGVPSNL
ncbi:MAG: hypothetical protein WDA71_00595 [Actinomycetota bacterium]